MNEDFITSALPSYVQVEDEKSDEQKAIEVEQVHEDYNLAALVDHPGWLQIRKQMETDIENFKTFKFINMSEYTDKELGEVVRTERMVADKLASYLNRIDQAVMAVVTSGKSG